MSIKSQARRAALRWGLEINRFNPLQSSQARLQRQLMTHRVDLIVDVGANDGGYARFVREAGYSGDILSFEPLQAPHRLLKDLSARDSAWYIAERVALGATDGRAAINVAANSKSSSLLPMLPSHLSAAPQSEYIAVEAIDVRRLDGIQHHVLANASRAFLKLDVQGFEMSVLDGAQGRLNQICGIQIECSLLPLYEGQALYLALFDWMSDKNFELWGVVPGFTDGNSGRMLQMDAVFFRPA